MNNDLGVIAYFRGSSRDIWIQPAALQAIISASGVDCLKVPDISNAMARVRAAATDFRANRGAYRAEVVRSTADEIDVGILERERVGDREVRWRQIETCSYSPTSGWTTTDGAMSGLFVGWADRWIGHVDYYLIRAMVAARLVRIGGFAMSGGGLRYLPADVLPEFERLRAVVGQIDGAHLYGIRLDGTDPITRQAVADAASQSLTEAVEDIVGQLAAWRERSKGRASTLERMLTDLGAIRDRAAGLADALRFSTAEIEQAVSACAADVEAALDEATGVRAAGPEAPEALVTPLVMAEAVEARDETLEDPSTIGQLRSARDTLDVLIDAREARDAAPAEPAPEPDPEPAPKGRAPKAPNPWLADGAAHPSVEDLETIPARQLIAIASKRYGIALTARDGDRKSQVQLVTEILSHPSRAGLHVTA